MRSVFRACVVACSLAGAAGWIRPHGPNPRSISRIRDRGEIEAGKKKPTAEFVLKVARYFKVSTDQLLKDELSVEDK